MDPQTDELQQLQPRGGGPNSSSGPETQLGETRRHQSHGPDTVEVPQGEVRERSRSPPRLREYTDAELLESMNRARKLDGMVPLKRLPSRSVAVNAEAEDDNDEALLVATEMRESNMTKEELSAFDIAKDDALRPWPDNACGMDSVRWFRSQGG